MASTGPKSTEGKRSVSQNARKHGFRCKQVILTRQQQTEIQTCIEFFTTGFPKLLQQHEAIFTQLGTAWWYTKQLDKLEDECFKITDYEAAVSRLYTLTRYRARHERLFHQAMDTLIKLIANCTIKPNPPRKPNHCLSHSSHLSQPNVPPSNKPEEHPETIPRINRRTQANANRKPNRTGSPSSNPYRAFPKPDTPYLMRHHCQPRNSQETNRVRHIPCAATHMPLQGMS